MKSQSKLIGNIARRVNIPYSKAVVLLRQLSNNKDIQTKLREQNEKQIEPIIF
ncbi:MAG: hypothetical protein J6T10_10325 [Methanobrevibacter sp.]|nr:hypothetical protein [Methanobrevibacter sp.]